jgi:sporulation protein YhbH
MTFFESKKIKSDYNRFKKIVRGKIKQNLKKYMSNGEMLGKQGKDFVSIPLPRINLPHFEHDFEKKGGVGQGEGEEGQPVGQGQGKPQDGGGQAGSEAGQHIMEVDVSLEELADILSEELQLPNIEPKGQKTKIQSEKNRYTSVNSEGPNSLRHFRRTYREALKRNIVSGTYNPKNPILVPIKNDMRYRSAKIKQEKTTSAVIVYIMDVSGSMGAEQKEIVRTESFWLDTWLRSQYKDIESRYIIHDAQAKEVDSETFYKTRESGGTIISSAYALAKNILEHHYPHDQWNTYVFHFSDGDNWSSEDTAKCITMLEKEFLPYINLFCYGQVESQYGSGQFLKDLDNKLAEADNLITSKIDRKEDIYESIKTFLGKGK